MLCRIMLNANLKTPRIMLHANSKREGENPIDKKTQLQWDYEYHFWSDLPSGIGHILTTK